VLAVLDPSPHRDRLSWSCTALQSFYQSSLAPVLVERSPHALCPDGLGFRGFAGSGRRPSPNVLGQRSSHGLVRSFRVPRAPSRRVAIAPSRARSDITAPPMRFHAPTAFPRSRQQSVRSGLPHPTDLRPQVFSTSRRLSIRREPAGLVSCRIRSWGSPFRAFLLPRGRTPFPAPIPS
jgi:hypothetical protein